jgi:hypothetical protein
MSKSWQTIEYGARRFSVGSSSNTLIVADVKKCLHSRRGFFSCHRQEYLSDELTVFPTLALCKAICSLGLNIGTGRDDVFSREAESGKTVRLPGNAKIRIGSARWRIATGGDFKPIGSDEAFTLIDLSATKCARASSDSCKAGGTRAILFWCRLPERAPLDPTSDQNVKSVVEQSILNTASVPVRPKNGPRNRGIFASRK